MIVFRSRLRDGVADAYNPDAERMFGLAVAMPGFAAAKDFVADDGERCAVIEFDSAEHLAAWRDHGEHAATQQRGRERYYSEYRLSVCGVIRESHFDGAVVTRRDADTRGEFRQTERLGNIIVRAKIERPDLAGFIVSD